jgi:hypothetical protein
MSKGTALKLYEARSFLGRVNATGSGEEEFYLTSGSRILVTLRISAIDPATTVRIHLSSAFDVDGPYDLIDTLESSQVGSVKRVYSDLNPLFRLTYEVIGGAASFKVGIAVFDNASTTRIENAQLSVNLDHIADVLGHFDSTRIGDGIYLLKINSSGGLHANLRDSLGNELLGTRISALSVPVVPASDWTERPTFIANAEDISIGNNKSMLSILNAVGSGVVIKIRKIFIQNVQITTVNGVAAEFQLRRITGHSAGTLITTDTHDTNDTLDSSVSVRTGATISGEIARNLKRWFWSSDEFDDLSTDVASDEHSFQQLLPHYSHILFTKPITLHPGEGITIRQETNSTAGTFDIMAEFTQE